jgi:hypothetical protein
VYLVTTTRRGCPEWVPGKPASQHARWGDHAAFMSSLVADGFALLGGTLDDDERALLVVDADSEDHVRETLARDPWLGSHFQIETVERWTIGLDAWA